MLFQTDTFAAIDCVQFAVSTVSALQSVPASFKQLGGSYREVDTTGENTTALCVRLNGAIAGVLEQWGAFYRGVPPGRYQIPVDSEGMSPAPPASLSPPGSRFVPGSGSARAGTGKDLPLRRGRVNPAAPERSKFYGG